MGIDHAAKIFSEAVLTALRGEGSPRERLADSVAVLSQLGDSEHLPANLQERFNVVMAACTRVPEPTDTMDYWEASKWLEEIFSLYADAIKREQRELIAREILAVRP